jgi:hypothetical protein
MTHAPDGMTLSATAGCVTLATLVAMALVIYGLVMLGDLSQAPLTQDGPRLTFQQR